MCAKGRVKWTENPLQSLLKQRVVRPFDERSEPGKPRGFSGLCHEKNSGGNMADIKSYMKEKEKRERRQTGYKEKIIRQDRKSVV